MAQKSYTYKSAGVTLAYLAQQVPGQGSVAAVVPAAFQTITWDETYKADLDAAMATKGFEYAYEGLAPAAKSIMQIVPKFLAADASSIPVASGWTDVLSETLTTLGGTSVGAQVTAVASPSVGVGQARLLVSGGAYSNTVRGATAYDIPISAQGCAAFHVPTPIADTSPDATVYTFKLQMQATGINGSVVPRAGSGFTLVENR